MHKKYRKHLHLLPFLFTFANAFLGFIAIVYALEGNFTYAVYSIMLAALMDMCDGRLARALGTTSMLGQELDSLADGISFGLAPCVVLYTWYPGVIGYTGFIALACYLSAGLYRLARFNLTASAQHYYSIGLPIPVAAFFVSNLVLYHEWILEHRIWFVLYKRVPFILITLIAGLMVSAIPFPSFKQLRLPMRLYVLPLAIALSHYLGIKVDPHIDNFMREKKTQKLVLVDSEPFTVMVGLRRPIQFNNYVEWYTALVIKCFCDGFLRDKELRKALYTTTAPQILRC